MARKTRFDAILLLQIAVGFFLVTLGIAGLMSYNTTLSEAARALNRIFGRTNNPLNLIIAIIEVVAGAVLVLDLFVTLAGRLQFWTTLFIVVLWVAQIVVVFFVNNLIEPDFITWLNRLSMDLIILVGLWMINRRYA